METIPGLDAVLFDLGNTLISFTPRDSMEFVLKWYYATPGLEDRVSINEFLHAFRTVVVRERKRMLQEPWETSVITRSKMIEDELDDGSNGMKGISVVLSSTHTGAFASCLRMNSNARHVLDVLSSSENDEGNPIKLGLISNAGDGAALRTFLAENDLEGYFGSIIISGEIGYAKPWPEIFHRCLAEIGADPGRSVYVGDRYIVDVEGSRKAGMNPVYIRQYHTSGEPPEGMQIDAPTIDHLLDLIPLLENSGAFKVQDPPANP
ncbi:MAG: HAD family hydrolase [Thermoplasmatota archaeon]